ncbi:putative protein ATP-dependent helicase LHR [Pyrococcus sp. NA2]|uniref:DEAD/DEAH box helicase n=1 Tax=Pyrococcus sp. (strain NA2) TaxID=342949 RepID=UPI000209ABFA|nr:DEAD/DEAH box helicase [Pyrococcus sp. NA2]AEC52712.1 putative protein ATP-dependent helicase LHR [Pyrococcus sp. NA2]
MERIRWAEREYKDEEIYAILDPIVREWFRRKFKSFTPPQRYAIVEIHKGENVLISSPTGSGKTLSAFLAIISELISLGRRGKLEDKIYCVYVSPLRALNNDIRRNLEEPLNEIIELARELKEEIPEIRVSVRTSDTSSYEKSKMLKKPPHILITTPESLAIAINAPKFREKLRDVKWVIVDEVHALAENKRGSHLTLTLERLRELCGRDFVRIGLSATIHPLEEVAKFVFGFDDKGNPRPGLIVDVSFAKKTEIRVESVVEDLIYTPANVLSETLYRRLGELIRKHRTTLIFTNTRSGAERVAYHLKKMFPEWEDKIEAHHSSLSREVRLDVEEKLKRGELKAVVCVPGHSIVFTPIGIKRIDELDNEDQVLGIKNAKGDFVKFGGVQKIEYNSKGVRIRTRLGFEVEATLEHKFLTMKNGQLIWREARELKPGDYVGIIRKLPELEDETLSKKFTPELARLLGFYLANGSKQMNVYDKLGKERPDLTSLKLEVLPLLSREHKIQFLSGYFDGNGYITKNEVGFILSDPKHIEVIRSILLQFGIIPSISGNKLKIPGGESFKRFKEIIDPWRDDLKEVKILDIQGEELTKGDILFDKIEEIEETFIGEAYGIIDSETGNYVVNYFISKNSSTSLELGIDIGTIDLVVLIGSPKSVNRALQRIGRAGHKLHEVSKGIILALDRDDLVEVTVLAHNARNRRLDRIKIPKNPLDVLVQHLLGMALERVWDVNEAYKVVRRAYPFRDLPFEDFMNVLKYLAGEYAGLEERKVYAKIWLENGKFGRRGKMTRAIYYMNTGTIPDEAKIDVFTMDKRYIGTVEEEFAERLMPGDIFVLAGRTYEFVKSKGNRIYVIPREGAKPTIPSWFSEMLPLSFDLALDIQRFRREVKAILNNKRAESFLMKKYGIDRMTAKAILSYFREQAKYSIIPDDETILVEIVEDGMVVKYFFHTLIGRRANDALSRAFAYLISRKKKCNVGMAITDNGFMLKVPRSKALTEAEILELFNIENLRDVLMKALENTELLKRRFRHVANRGLLILRRYMGKKKSLSKQQMNAQTLLNFLKKNYPDFPLLKEVYREIMEDKMDIENAELFLRWIKEGKIKVIVKRHPYPSPFAFNLEVVGASDVVLMEDRRELIKELHKKIMELIKEGGVPSPTAPRSPFAGV